jgi:hypothetical protein
MAAPRLWPRLASAVGLTAGNADPPTIREEVAGTAAPQAPVETSADVADAPKTVTRTQLGGADRSAQADGY